MAAVAGRRLSEGLGSTLVAKVVEEDIMAGWIALVLAAIILTWAALLKVAELWLRRRLVKVEAQLLDPGRMLHAAQRSLTNSDGSQPRIGQPSIWDSDAVYVAAWEYVVEGKRYRGEIQTSTPCFSKKDMPPARVHVYFDRANPSKSWPTASGQDRNSLPWFIFGCVVASVGAALALLSD